MKPAPFEYHAPTSLADAVTLLARLENEGCDAKILAGGQSLMPMLAMRVARPDALVDLRQVPGLDHIRLQDGRIAIGAMASKRAAELSELVRERQPLFHAATRLVGHQQIRNRGSVGGSFAHADPASEYPAVALVLDMEMVATGPDGERVIPAAEFFVTYMTTALEPGEVLTEVRMPVLPPGTGWAIREITRRSGDLALAGVALTLRLKAGRCADARIAAFGIDATAVRLSEAEDALRGAVPTTESFARAGAVAAASLADPMSCIHASAEYRRHLVGTLLERALADAAARAH
ncbi:xanthine dehydrogenase family protein subunit M [Aromatoleum toluolicum]|uniref:Xanthine dehydrogenase family protein subunit M n=1 Tax=Aromatoleum toluolicum TaxID=90060 RepID=A0ABX1NP24_9RHOO|nr:xanthine dehydrogenase family protein subunit M [Aromatoleum toluolicum]NMG01128.1 xanthine dehydrogenase family protein subunit M [Aromatoleum toluolicum]